MASARQRKASTSSARKKPRTRKLKPFTLDHFRAYVDLLVFDDGQKRGLEPWQVEIARDIFRGYREVWMVVPEGNGKALDVETPLPLAGGGYVEMGDVRPGDRLVGSDGNPTTVLRVGDVLLDRDCFEVRFSDGASIVADAEHLWAVEGAHDDYRPRVLTTRQMRDVGVELSSGARRWRIPAARGKTCRHRRITAIEPVPTRPVRCIQVAAPDHLFQAGIAGILTHNSTFISALALYGADYSESPWIPIGASSAKQARIIYDQAAGFVSRTEGLDRHFRCYGGYRLIRSQRNGGVGIEVFAADAGTGDGVIPHPFALMDELHRTDMSLYRLWAGKLRKRNSQILGISTAGEPETPFENTRDRIRRSAEKRRRKGAHLRAEGGNVVMHEWMVESDEACSDMKAVKAANPLSTITTETLREDFESGTTDMGDWRRLKCNRPTRSVQTAITDREWEDAQVADWPVGEPVIAGLDVGWKWDTTALQPLWVGPDYRLLGAPWVLTPPRDGSSLHPDEIKNAFIEAQEANPIETLVMDMHRAEDIAAWVEDELGITVIDRGQSNQFAVADYNAFMDGLRNGTLKHTGDGEQRRQVLNAIARRLPGGDYRFDRPSSVRANKREQDRRVIDVLSAAAMAVEYSTRRRPAVRSVYEDRGLVAV